ncbi:class I SAM-dependent methyltransferase [Lacrimispora xylanolytica]|uniref:Class I SAM-dependent methyltransferase n=1 Tax=Lacrimispora xylanolytica TaxID=29375 RepID=A0ABY7ADA6_9FIRM|nr:class I SAM-dependent methyltransferase [Lacrimispora xylanolytica]WAJ24551.1 class I SAM-dependent methyltransferase [Lacrimispora xylanolytica]
MSYYEYYSKWHDHTNEDYIKHMHEYFTKIIEDHLPDNKDSNILEMACSNGMALLTLRDKGYNNLTGIDIDEDLVNVARGFNLNAKKINALKFFETNREKYDFIYAIDFIEHLSNEEFSQLMLQCKNSLNKNGKLLMVTPNAISPVSMYYRYIDYTHKTIFTPSSLSYALNNLGFNDILVSDLNVFSDKSNWYLKTFRAMMTTFFEQEEEVNIVTPNFIAVAQYNENLERPVTKFNYEQDKFDIFEEISQIKYNLQQIQKESDG